MSYSREPVITCDEPRCGQWADAYGHSGTEIRANAKRAGWQVGLPGGLDFCPKHHRTKSSVQSEGTN